MRACVCVCVCVCILLVYFGDSPSDQGETFASLCSVCILSVRLNHPRSHRRGRTLGLFCFSFFVFLLCPPPPPAVFAYILCREKGSAVPSLVDNDVEFCQLTKLFSFYCFRPPDQKVRKKILSPSLAEIRNRELAARRLRGSTGGS